MERLFKSTSGDCLVRLLRRVKSGNFQDPDCISAPKKGEVQSREDKQLHWLGLRENPYISIEEGLTLKMDLPAIFKRVVP
jgi:hypothetical protein